jgi:hypothetical protein
VGSLRLLYSESGETLGPSGLGSSAVSTVHPFLKVLLGSRRFGVRLERGGKSRRAQRLRVFIASSIRRYLHFFSFGHVFAVAPAFLCIELLYHRCGCYKIYSGAKACFVKPGFTCEC